MAKSSKPGVQSYPRIQEESDKYHAFFDDSKVTPHSKRIDEKKLKEIIEKAIKSANFKSSRAILNITENISEQEINKTYIKGGKELFKYFIKYCGDPASSAFDSYNQHYSKMPKNNLEIERFKRKE
jgi:hypothetical protein